MSEGLHRGASKTGRRPGVVVVTGAAQGIGAAVVADLTAAGYSVVGLDRQATADVRALDVTDADGWAALAEELRREHGAVHGLVANAGITCRDRLTDVTPADLARVYDVNAGGVLLAIQSLAPLMAPGSAIVVVGSVAGLTAHFPAAYTASKWALRGLARVAALELGPRGIRVNTVHPGYIETPLTASAAPAFRAANVAETALGRTGTVADVVPLVRFLLSDAAGFITGAEIPVDGGLTAHGGVKSISDAVRDPS